MEEIRMTTKHANEIYKSGGAVNVSDWVTTDGRRRDTPDHCVSIDMESKNGDTYSHEDLFLKETVGTVTLTNFAKKALAELVGKTPDIKTAIVMNDIRGFRKEWKKGSE